MHKDRNLQRHLPKRYRKQAHHLFSTALEQNSYKDAKKMLQEFERWLRGINESAADSLLEALEEVLTLHRLKVPALLRKSLHGDVLRSLSKKKMYGSPNSNPSPELGADKENHTSWERYYQVSDCSSSLRNDWYSGI